MTNSHRRRIGAVLCLCVALLSGACSSIKVQHVDDPSADWSAMRTFAMVPNKQDVLTDRMLMGQPLRADLEQSIGKALAARGRSVAPAGQAQMIVRWVANISYSEGEANTGTSRMDLRKEFAAQDYVYSVDNSGAIPYLVTNGTVVVDIVNAQTNKSVWRGMISGVVKEKLSDPERQARLDKALAKLFESVPMW